MRYLTLHIYLAYKKEATRRITRLTEKQKTKSMQ